MCTTFVLSEKAIHLYLFKKKLSNTVFCDSEHHIVAWD